MSRERKGRKGRREILVPKDRKDLPELTALLANLDRKARRDGYPVQGVGADSDDLPDDAGEGDAYLAEDDDHLWIWNGEEWTDGGNIQGPPGAAGSPGQDGSRGSMWYSVNGDPNGILTSGNVAGDQAVDTVTGDVYEFTP